MKKLLYKVIFLLSVTLLLIAGNSCEKVDWPVVPESSVNKVDTNTVLDSVAVYNVIIAANTPPQTVQIVSSTETVTTTYSYNVGFAIYAKGDVNYTTPLYIDSVSISGIPYPPESSTNSSPIQYVLPVHYNVKTNGCVERSKFIITKLTTTLTDRVQLQGGKKVHIKSTTYSYSLAGGQANVSNTCQGFTVGTISNTNHMIYSQTGTATID